MTNLQAMQDERLQDLIHQVEQFRKLKTNLIVSDFEMERLLNEEITLRWQITDRWRELLEDT